ncbi:hypothetical protein BDW74DRAFT_38437 [Aspergillus multicolor]|uniref:uncharacterized protein n=1 Tax=Aspergillus multicolor TaxID=41759 RepID=UPI003CCE29D5
MTCKRICILGLFLVQRSEVAISAFGPSVFVPMRPALLMTMMRRISYELSTTLFGLRSCLCIIDVYVAVLCTAVVLTGLDWTALTATAGAGQGSGWLYESACIKEGRRPASSAAEKRIMEKRVGNPPPCTD